MRYLRKNTQTSVTVGPFVDATDGYTVETALVGTDEKLTLIIDDAIGGTQVLALDKNGGTGTNANYLNHITGDDAGLYSLDLQAADVNYVGRGVLVITAGSTHLPVFHEFQLVPANIYDSWVAGTDYLDVNVFQTGGTTTTGGDALYGTNVQLTSIPTTTDSLAKMIQFLFQYFRNKRTVTSSAETMFKEDASTPVGTAVVSDDGSTFTKGEMN